MSTTSCRVFYAVRRFVRRSRIALSVGYCKAPLAAPCVRLAGIESSRLVLGSEAFKPVPHRRRVFAKHERPRHDPVGSGLVNLRTVFRRIPPSI